MLLLYPRPVLLCQVGQRDIGTKEEGVTKIVIFDVQRAPQTRGHLYHKTELAPVVAASDVGIERGMGKSQTKRLCVVSLDRHGELLVLSLYLQLQDLLRGIVLDIDHIAQRMSIDSLEHISRHQSCLGPHSGLFDRGDQPTHTFDSSPQDHFVQAIAPR